MLWVNLQLRFEAQQLHFYLLVTRDKTSGRNKKREKVKVNAEHIIFVVLRKLNKLCVGPVKHRHQPKMGTQVDLNEQKRYLRMKQCNDRLHLSPFNCQDPPCQMLLTRIAHQMSRPFTQ